MALRVGLIVDAEFLRLVLRQLLGRMAGVEVLADVERLADIATLPPVDLVLTDVALCTRDPSGFAAMCRAYSGRIVLLGDGDTVARDGLIIPPEMVRVAMGTATTPRALSMLGSLLETALRPFAEKALARRPPLGFRSADQETPGREKSPDAGPPDALLVSKLPPKARARRPELVLIAASTGGPEALQELLTALRPPVCPVVIALHIPAEHTSGLARHLAAVTGHTVTVGEIGPLPKRGVVLLQGGEDHLIALRNDALWLRPAPRANSVFHPNGDVLFNSGAILDRAVVGVVLTGMGSDGCAGASALASRGFPVLAQTLGSCAVPGMPAAAIAAGAVREIALPSGIAERLNTWFELPVPD
jgi:two-component system chemotaxis response regulator CheB